MLPRKNRLTKKIDYERVIRKGASFSFGEISLKFLKNAEGIAKIGFLVGKKSGRKPSARNAIKRKLRHLFLKELKNIKPGFDIVVFCRYYEKEGKKFELEKHQVEKLLEKSQLLKNKIKNV